MMDVAQMEKVRDSDKNGDTKAGYLNNGLSRLDSRSWTASIGPARAYTGKLRTPTWRAERIPNPLLWSYYVVATNTQDLRAPFKSRQKSTS